MFKGKGKYIPLSCRAASIQVPAAGREPSAWGHAGNLGQERVKCVHFPFLRSAAGSCWLSRHSLVAAVGPVPYTLGALL